jgi:two-component system, sensor histidine kinase and response regulator
MKNPPPIRILVAEDSPTQALRLRLLLERSGYEVIVAADGREALEAARREKPTLVISDVVMPEMDGYGLSRSIKSDSDLRQIPVMLVTTLSDPQDVIRGIEAGADNFVVKPYEEDYLAARVGFLLDNNGLGGGEESTAGVRIRFKGEDHLITATREQILNLLLSTYEAAIERNRELARAQAELESVNTQLSMAMRELESFSHSVSHDLRSPVNKIRGFGELLLEDYAARLDETGRHYLDRMIAGAARMEELIEAMLRLSRVSQEELAAREFDLGALARRTLDELREQEPGRAVEAHIGQGLAAWGDPHLVEIVLCNLIGNAWKFTSRREVARIEVGRLPGAPGSPGRFYVRDNGAGFDPAQSARLFTPFQRLHGDFPGTGIGLATVRRVIERHGGSVHGESEPGRGATFYFSLPPPPADRLAHAAVAGGR